MRLRSVSILFTFYNRVTNLVNLIFDFQIIRWNQISEHLCDIFANSE